MHEDEAKGNDDRHAWGCGDEKGEARGGIGAEGAPISHSSLVHWTRGQGWMHSKVGTSVRMDRDIYALSTGTSLSLCIAVTYYLEKTI